MPAKSNKQRKAMAIAEHAPEKLYKRNNDLKKMSKKQLHDFASTKGMENGYEKGKNKEKKKKRNRKEKCNR